MSTGVTMGWYAMMMTAPNSLRPRGTHQDQAREDGVSSQWQGDGEEDPRRRSPQSQRCVLQALGNGGKAIARGIDEIGQADKRHGRHDAGGVADKIESHRLAEPT